MGMAKDRLDSSTVNQVKLRNLAIRQPDRKVVQVCADDGSRDGFPVGWAELAPHPHYRRLSWHTVVRTVPGDDYSYWHGGLARRASYGPVEHGGRETLGAAIREILTLAQWGDVLADHEVRSGRTGTYLATMDPKQADWLAKLDEPKGITHLGGGRVRLDNVVVALFRGAPEVNMYVDADDVFHIHPMDPPIQLTRER
ncbi:hypothetical protein ABT279_27305 [Amycolatopsis sp. NPDC000673]|uniref:hypothetical protein n=1 Tax=Amycolatopsis sp. NPDC000673 TaxID=3154267 RepID=UPI00331DEC14